jgi:ribosomal protein S18 acetylase RimI-like enzyme
MERGVFLVAVVDGEVVGFADFFAASPDEVELAAIYVLPEAHGQGIGTRLLEEGLARFPRAKRCVLEVARDNAGARRFYAARGFRAVGESVWRFAGGEAVELRVLREISAGVPGRPDC